MIQIILCLLMAAFNVTVVFNFLHDRSKIYSVIGHAFFAGAFTVLTTLAVADFIKGASP